jgi:glycosyltransferase involved in cell wall biosynthesis
MNLIKDKILIFFNREININSGGPSGFLAHNYADKPRNTFVLSSDLFDRNRFRYVCRRLFFNWPSNEDEFIYNEIGARNFKFIYFHDCYTFERVKGLIPPGQIVILQSHSPELPSKEQESLNSPKELIEFTRSAEINSFRRANIVVFPNPDCLPLYDSLIFDRSKVRYLLSGCKSFQTNSKFPLDPNKINILYIGRRNYIKGFDYLMKSFSRVMNVRADINLLIVGNGDFVDGNNIFDIGFSSTPYNWVRNVDYVINANRQSYFDLSVLESLSCGAKLILASNFGHKYFDGVSEDILCFNVNDEDSLFNLLISNDIRKSEGYSKANLDLYNSKFTDNHYMERFIAFHQELISQT